MAVLPMSPDVAAYELDRLMWRLRREKIMPEDGESQDKVAARMIQRDRQVDALELAIERLNRT